MDIYPKDDGVLLTEKNSLRKSIHEFIIESQHKDGILDSEWKTLLNFIKKAMEICPEVLVVNSRCVVSTQDHAFLLWVIQNLLMVLTQATSVHLQTGIGDCIQNIFTLTESRDHPVFCYLLRETVQMVSDLSDLYQISTTPNIVKFPVYLSHYQNSPTKTKELKEQSADSFPLELLPMLVEINNVTQLGLLLENMLLTMNCFCDEVCMFYPGATNLVYQIVCSTLKFGDLNIKLASLTIIESLIKGGEFASTALMDNVLWSLISTVTFCTRLLLENERVPDEFQHKLCSCLRICFCPSEGEPYAVLRFWDYLLSAVQCVLTHQSYSLCSPDLQVCVGQVLHRCSLMTIFLPSFRAEVIIDSVGKVKNLQPLVPALYQLLRAELSSKNVDGEVGSKEDSEKSEKSDLLDHHKHMKSCQLD